MPTVGRFQLYAMTQVEVPQWDRREKPLNRVDAWLLPDSGTEMSVDLSAANLGCRPDIAVLKLLSKEARAISGFIFISLGWFPKPL